MATATQPIPCSFFWLGVWHNGLVIRWIGIHHELKESTYEVSGDGWNLYHHPKSLIVPKTPIDL